MIKILLQRVFIFLCVLFFSARLMAQNTGSIKGRLFDEKSDPMSFATVRLDGTTQAMNTDVEGNF